MSAETMLWIFIAVCSVMCVVELIAMRARQNHIKTLQDHLAAMKAHDEMTAHHRAWLNDFYEDIVFSRKERPTRLQ